MNDNIAHTKEYAEAHEFLDLVEILDADGEPTGFYEASTGEAASEKSKAFVADGYNPEYIAEDASDHAVTVH